MKQIHTPGRLLLAFATVAALQTGCATGLRDDTPEWRDATVEQVLRRDQLPARIDRTCLAALEDPGEYVALVRYRVARAAYLHAFNVPSGVQFSPAGLVRVQSQGCAIKAKASS